MLVALNSRSVLNRSLILRCSISCITPKYPLCSATSPPHLVFNAEELSFLTNRQFLQKHGVSSIGILGKEILSNLHSEWRRCNVVGSGVEEIGEVGSMEGKSIIEQLRDVVLHHVSTNKLNVRKPLTSSFATSLRNSDADPSNLTLALAKFVEGPLENLEFENLHSDKVWWIKKYLRKPALVGTAWGSNSDLANSSTNKVVTAQYVYGDVKMTVQCSTLLAGDDLRACSWIGSKSASVSMVIIRHSLCDLLATILADSFHQISFPNYGRSMMRVHPHLAPIKTALSIDGEVTGQLKKLAAEMVNWLRRMNVTCWDAAELGMDDTDLDNCGVPYGIVISAQTLEDGILCIRHRDSSLKVQAHISEVVTKLKLYLQPKS